MNSLRILLVIWVTHPINIVNSWRSQCECGIANRFDLNPRIIGGEDYDPFSYPWLVLLQLNGSFLCGGSLISDSYVLSAAHCWNYKFDQSDLKVLLGKHDRCKPDIHSSLLSVSEISIHGKFNERDFSADIMLLKLSLQLNFNRYIRPICLPLFDIRRNNNAFRKYRNKVATVLGWGKTSIFSKEPNCLPRQLHVPILKPNECGIHLNPSLFCAGFTAGGRDSCQGDSGGPLQILNPSSGQFELIGIISNGIGCALSGHPGLYTDVMRYLPWIRKRVSSSFCD